MVLRMISSVPVPGEFLYQVATVRWNNPRQYAVDLESGRLFIINGGHRYSLTLFCEDHLMERTPMSQAGTIIGIPDLQIERVKRSQVLKSGRGQAQDQDCRSVVQPDFHQDQLPGDTGQACLDDFSVTIQLKTVDLCVSG